MNKLIYAVLSGTILIGSPIYAIDYFKYEDLNDTIRRSKPSQHITLVEMIKHGKSDKIIKGLQQGKYDVFSTGKKGDTLLHWAAGLSKTELMRYLITRGVEIDVLDNNMHTPLFWSATSGNYEGVKILLEQGADLTIKDQADKTIVERMKGRGDKSFDELFDQYDDSLLKKFTVGK